METPIRKPAKSRSHHKPYCEFTLEEKQKHRKSSAMFYRRNRDKILAQKKAERNKPLEIVIAGKKYEVYRIHKLAKELKKTTQTIRLWENNALLPKAILKDKSGNRLYTTEQINKIVETHRRYCGMTKNAIKELFEYFKNQQQEILEGVNNNE